MDLADDYPDSDMIGCRFLKFKTTCLLFIVACIFQFSYLISPWLTFFILDCVLSVYLLSLFQGNLRYLFFFHPLFVFISAPFFQIPYDEIGVGFTYLDTFNMVIDSTTLGLSSGLGEYYSDKESVFGFGKVYFGIIPIIFLPNLIAIEPEPHLLYYSMSLFSLIYVALAAFVSRFYNILTSKNLLIIALYATVSPTFLEINSTLHRYSMLIGGLFLFLLSYIGLREKNRSKSDVFGLLIFTIISIFFIGFSKPQIIYVLIMFISLDLLFANKLHLISRIFIRMDRRLFFVLVVFFLQIFSLFILPEEHKSIAANYGGQLTALANVPILGFILRLVYAVLSPFPWVGFAQWELYGFNYMFLFVHIISAFLAAWIILSVIFSLNKIWQIEYQDRLIIIFGICVLFSINFSAIGFHVYLAPALPFLSILLSNKGLRVNAIYPLIFCITLEVVAHMARLI
tara:strand:+ start:314 stop:1681 length:1368 start_codon:yes stop_codon:yes gene_type:complete